MGRLEEELIRLADASGPRPRRCRSGSCRRPVVSGSSAAGAPRGLQLFRGWRTVVGVLGGVRMSVTITCEVG